jgi:glycine betaine catabolism A
VSSSTGSTVSWLNTLIAKRMPGHSLQREFYTHRDVYDFDLQYIWRRGWLFAGHTCQVPEPGDYFTLEVDEDSIVIIRDDNGSIHGLHNVCRHRGTRVCPETSGHVNRIVCPYHQWVYARNGTLVSCRGMQEELDKNQWGLHPVHLREVEGLIYISLAEEALDFEPARELLASMLPAQGLTRAKVAKMVDYDIHANWKLVWENNRECWHCNVNHPQYVKANFDHYNADDTSERVQQRIAQAVARSETEWAAAGLAVSHKQTGLTLFPDAENQIWFSANRTPLVEGYVSETMDGKQVAPLMGDYTSATVGTLRMRTLPNFWNHASCDHAVSTRLLPAGPRWTKARVIWLVDQDAVEGKDYDLEKLLPFWQMTSEQDWQLCDNQQRGVNSSAYTPGPYSTYKEYNVERFVRWYLGMLATGPGQPFEAEEI